MAILLRLVPSKEAFHSEDLMHSLRFARFARGFWFAVLSAILLPLARAEDAAKAETPPKNFSEALQRSGLKVIAGPANYALGNVAEIRLPAGYHAVEAGSIKDYYALTQNTYSGNEVGVVIGPGDWVMVFDYDETGYIKDDEKNALDADKLMETMLKGQEASNKERVKLKWDEMRFNGWANPPRYDPQTNNLTWAVRLTSSSDGYKSVFLNESIRLLGRGGVMNVTLITEPDAYAKDSATVSALLSKDFNYVTGQKYGEFKQGDKIAEYGLAALVLGGAGAAAFKLGFFQKFWKFFVFGGLGLAAFAKKFWNKITGKNPDV